MCEQLEEVGSYMATHVVFGVGGANFIADISEMSAMVDVVCRQLTVDIVPQHGQLLVYSCLTNSSCVIPSYNYSCSLDCMKFYRLYCYDLCAVLSQEGYLYYIIGENND